MAGAGAAPRKRHVYWTARAQEDLAHWDKADRRIARRVRELIEHVREHPFTGIGTSAASSAARAASRIA